MNAPIYTAAFIRPVNPDARVYPRTVAELVAHYEFSYAPGKFRRMVATEIEVIDKPYVPWCETWFKYVGSPDGHIRAHAWNGFACVEHNAHNVDATTFA